MIYCIMGPTATGKTTIARKAADELGLEVIVSYTSRPIRPREIDGVDYHFVDNAYFDENAEDFIEMREYTVYDGSIWKYGFKKNSFKSKKDDYIAIVDPGGFEAFKEYFGENHVMAILIESFQDELFTRLQKRGDNPEEIKRRIADDIQRFAAFKRNNQNWKIVYNHFELDFAVIQTVKNILGGCK